MKILRVINSLATGGAERSIETNVPIHCDNGYKTDIFLLKDINSSFKKSLIKNNIKVYSHPSNKSVYNPIHIFHIIPLLKSYDIVHVHLFPALYWVAIAKIISRSKCKLVYTEHSTSNKRRKTLLFKLLDKLIYKQYDKIICITKATQENLSNHLGHNYPMVTINNGVDLKPFQDARPSEDILSLKNKGNFILLQIASFRYPKDQLTVIKALPFLNKNIHIVFAGVGKRIEECKNLASELDVIDRVHFLGNRDDIPNLVTTSDIVIMSSVYEGFGRGAIEGMAGRRPVIATNVSGLADIVRGAGILFDVGDFKRLADIVNELINNPVRYKEVSISCYERSKDYNVSFMISKYENVYDSLK